MTYNHISHRSHSSLEMMEKTQGIDKSILRKTNSLVIETVGWDPGDPSSVSRPVPNVSASLRAKHRDSIHNVIQIPEQTFKYIFVCFCAYIIYFALFSIKADLSQGLIQGASRQALENLPALAEDDTTLSCLLPKATPYPPNYISISHFSIKSGSLAQTYLQRPEITCLDFVSKWWRCRQVSPAYYASVGGNLQRRD